MLLSESSQFKNTTYFMISTIFWKRKAMDMLKKKNQWLLEVDGWRKDEGELEKFLEASLCELILMLQHNAGI